jgi:hypothetical protein
MGYSAVSRIGRYSPSELSVLMLPREVNPTRRAVIYAHGANGDGSQVLDAANQRGVVLNAAALANAGLVVVSGDFGGAQTWGNDTELAAMEGAWSYLQASGLCATDKVVLLGTSMGFLSISRFAKEHPSWVAAMNGWIPGIDVEDIRTRDALGSRSLINTAWGLPAGSYVGGADQTPVPTRGRPLDSANLAAVAGIPTHLWYSSGDTVCVSAAVTSYAAGRANVTTHLCSSAEHSDAAVLAADVPTVVEFVQSVA